MTYQALPAARLRPIIAIVADRTEFHNHPAHLVLHGYVRAVQEVSGGMPILIPALGDSIDAETLIASIDGIVFTGSPSNVCAQRYGGEPLPDETVTDRDRDGTVFQLLPRVIEAGIPILGICRGFQEMNVAHGGSLHPAVHDLPGKLDHREGDHDRPLDLWYEDSHDIEILPGGRLATLTSSSSVRVNSLHHQGVDRLGEGLRVEAVAPDGLIEAFSIAGASQFTLAVQWHPEMRVVDCTLARSIFITFGAACLVRNAGRLGAAEPQNRKRP